MRIATVRIFFSYKPLCRMKEYMFETDMATCLIIGRSSSSCSPCFIPSDEIADDKYNMDQAASDKLLID